MAVAGVRHQLGEAQDGVIRSLAAIQYPGQESACLPDLRCSGGESTEPADQRNVEVSRMLSPAPLTNARTAAADFH